MAMPPMSAKRALILGSARAAFTSQFSLSTISAGVFFGAPTPPRCPSRSPARFGDRRQVGQRVRARRRRHRQRAQGASLDVR